jgi:hypothetical protein
MITKTFISAKTFRAYGTNFFRQDKKLRDHERSPAQPKCRAQKTRPAFRTFHDIGDVVESLGQAEGPVPRVSVTVWDWSLVLV